MEEGCAQEQKRVALGRGHQDAEAIDAARQAPPPPPPTLSNPLRFPPFSRSLSSLSLSSLETVISDSRSSPPFEPSSLCLYLRLDAFKQKTAWKKLASLFNTWMLHIRDQLFSPGLLDITLRFHGRDEYELRRYFGRYVGESD